MHTDVAQQAHKLESWSTWGRRRHREGGIAWPAGLAGPAAHGHSGQLDHPTHVLTSVSHMLISAPAYRTGDETALECDWQLGPKY